jgi:hypothetical protein
MWTPTDSVRFREYLKNTNSNLIAHLTESIPVLTVIDSSTVENVALSGAYKAGFEKAVFVLKQMAIVETKTDDASSSSFVTM